jgi:hypothetical protein
MGLRSRLLCLARRAHFTASPLQALPPENSRLRKRLDSSDRLIEAHPEPMIEEYVVQTSLPRRRRIPSRTAQPVSQQYPNEALVNTYLCETKLVYGELEFIFIAGLMWLMILSPLAASFLGLAGVTLVTSLIVDTRGELDNPTEDGKKCCKKKVESKDRKGRKESETKWRRQR